MDPITVVFTGLMIFDGGTVHLVKASHHQRLVHVEQGNSSTVHEVRTSIAFTNVGDGGLGVTTGFQLPKLTKIFQHGSLTVKPGSVSLALKTGTMGPYGSYAHCMVKNEPTVFWEGVQWRVAWKEGAALVIDGQTPIELEAGAKIRISNNYTVDDGSAHVEMYRLALNESVSFSAPKCDGPYPAPEAKQQLRFLRNNPITCPPASLQ